MALWNSHFRKNKHRKGGALVELAVCLPLFFMIAMATIETCRMLYVRQSLKIAAYECARISIVPKATKQAVLDQCELILDGRRIRGYSITCTPDDPASLSYGDLMEVTISAGAEDNDLLGTWFYREKIFRASVTIMAEY